MVIWAFGLLFFTKWFAILLNLNVLQQSSLIRVKVKPLLLHLSSFSSVGNWLPFIYACWAHHLRRRLLGASPPANSEASTTSDLWRCTKMIKFWWSWHKPRIFPQLWTPDIAPSKLSLFILDTNYQMSTSSIPLYSFNFIVFPPILNCFCCLILWNLGDFTYSRSRKYELGIFFIELIMITIIIMVNLMIH